MDLTTPDQQPGIEKAVPINARDAEIIACNRRRQILPERLFGDLLWEILLQLDHAEHHGLVAHGVPAPETETQGLTRAERYIQILIAEGLVSRDTSGPEPILALTDLAKLKLFQIFNRPPDPDELACPTEHVSGIISFKQMPH